jgi:hypothetical protein
VRRSRGHGQGHDPDKRVITDEAEMEAYAAQLANRR